MPDQTEAGSAAGDLLARAYLEILAKEEGAKIRPMLRKRSGVDDPVGALLDQIADDAPIDTPSLRADLAAAAILTAKAVASEPDLMRKFRRESPVVVVSTHTADMVSLTESVVRTCALGAEFSRYHLVSRDGSERSHAPEKGNGEVLAALHRRWTVVGIAADPARHLPSALMRAAEYRISLPPMDDAVLRLVIEAVSGEEVASPIDPELIRGLDVADLPFAVRSGLSAEECIGRLRETITRKGDPGEGPALEGLEGYGAAKKWGLELVADLADYRAGRIGWDLVDHKGLLLSGPPGVGKTTFARALAKSARVPLIASSVAQWNAASYLSGTLQAVRDVFGQAKRSAPSILFIDEIDGISDRSTIRGEYIEYWIQIVNLLLEMLAGIDERQGVVVIAATNYPEKIDAAIKRAGRLDREIVLEKPDAPTLAKIFRHYLGEATFPGVDLMPLGLAARGSTGADVEAWVRRAKASARRGRRDLRLDDILGEIRSGVAALSPEARRRVACHEAGHVVLSRILNVGKLVGVSIHDAGGATEVESRLDGTATLDEIERHIAMWLAGRAAEELLLGAASIGAGSSAESDLGRATRWARALETDYGLGMYGNLFVEPGLTDHLVRIPGLLEAVKSRLDRIYDRARDLLGARRGALERIATALEATGYLSGEEVDRLMAAEPSAGAHGRSPKFSGSPRGGMLADGDRT